MIDNLPPLPQEWTEELKGMASRIQRMRVLFLEALLVSVQTPPKKTREREEKDEYKEEPTTDQTNSSPAPSLHTY